MYLKTEPPILLHTMTEVVEEKKIEPKYQALDLNNKGNEVCLLTAKYPKYSKFWSVSLEHFVERKPLIYEEWHSRSVKDQI